MGYIKVLPNAANNDDTNNQKERSSNHNSSTFSLKQTSKKSLAGNIKSLGLTNFHNKGTTNNIYYYWPECHYKTFT